MPIYVYHCDACEHDEEDIQLMRDDAYTICPQCGSDTYHRVPTIFDSGGLQEFRKPIQMQSVAATTPEEVIDLANKCPGIEMSINPDDELYGVPIAKNRKEKMQVLKAVGFIERN